MSIKTKLENYIKRLIVEALQPELDDLFEKIAIECGGEIRIAALNLRDVIQRKEDTCPQ